MRKLLIVGVFLNAALLMEIWAELSAEAEGDAGTVATLNGDVNGDGERDISDASFFLNWLFKGGPEPVAIAEEDSLSGEDVALLKQILPHLSVERLPARIEGVRGNFGDLVGTRVTETAKTIRFSGVNVQIVNGLGSTNGNPDFPLSSGENEDEPTVTNGLGNLVVGYQEVRPFDETAERHGSHNIVVGRGHDYTSFGGLLAGVENTVAAPYCSVSGGRGNTASGLESSITGGEGNIASGDLSSVTGGISNTAIGGWASVTAGGGNRAIGYLSTVSGGGSNIAMGRGSTVCAGGYWTRDYQPGRNQNRAEGEFSSVSGGAGNVARGVGAAVSGGGHIHGTAINVADTDYSVVSGGQGNVTFEDGQVVP